MKSRKLNIPEGKIHYDNIRLIADYFEMWIHINKPKTRNNVSTKTYDKQ
jgi:hypothetical protein